MKPKKPYNAQPLDGKALFPPRGPMVEHLVNTSVGTVRLTYAPYILTVDHDTGTTSISDVQINPAAGTAAICIGDNYAQAIANAFAAGVEWARGVVGTVTVAGETWPVRVHPEPLGTHDSGQAFDCQIDHERHIVWLAQGLSPARTERVIAYAEKRVREEVAELATEAAEETDDDTEGEDWKRAA